MNKKEIKFIVNNNPLFDKLKRRQISKLVNICEIKEYKDGQIIYSEGDAPDYFYLLLKGRVVVSAKEEQIDCDIQILKRGTCFGIISLLTDDNHSVSARSIESSSVLQVQKDKFKEFLRSNPLMSLSLSSILFQRVKARSKPKRIFQSKKIGFTGNALGESTDYMFNLALELKNQTKKNIIVIQVIPQDEPPDPFINKDFYTGQGDGKILSLANFSEGNISEYIISKGIDCLYINVGLGGNFLPLINFLSESYHFILYSIAEKLLIGNSSTFINPAHEVHYLSFSGKEALKKGAFLINKLKSDDPLNEKRIKVVLLRFPGEDNISYDKKRKVINQPIYATLPTAEYDSYPKVLRRIAREIGEVTLGLALGSGAAYGFSHIGVLKVFEENDIDIDIICGSSMGALIAALWAVGFKTQDIEKFANEFGRRISTFSIIGLSFPFKGIMKAKRLERIFKDIFKDLTFYDLKHTLKVVAFDFTRRKTVVLQEGFLYKAVAASCAFPGIFEPIKFKKDILLDGGILNPLPTKILLNFDAHKIIASNITLSKEQVLRSYKKRNKFHIFDFIFGSIEMMQQQFIEQAIKIADVVIHPNLEGLAWLEFEKISEFIKRGEKATRDKLSEIKEFLFL